MEFNEYQKKSRESAIYPEIGSNYIYPALGIAGETGEVIEKVKKIIRDKEGIVSEKDKMEISKELGDILWYISQLASELKIDLNTIAQGNLDKIKSRLERNVLGGSGDNR